VGYFLILLSFVWEGFEKLTNLPFRLFFLQLIFLRRTLLRQVHLTSGSYRCRVIVLQVTGHFRYFGLNCPSLIQRHHVIIVQLCAKKVVILEHFLLIDPFITIVFLSLVKTALFRHRRTHSPRIQRVHLQLPALGILIQRCHMRRDLKVAGRRCFAAFEAAHGRDARFVDAVSEIFGKDFVSAANYYLLKLIICQRKCLLAFVLEAELEGPVLKDILTMLDQLVTNPSRLKTLVPKEPLIISRTPLLYLPQTPLRLNRRHPSLLRLPR